MPPLHANELTESARYSRQILFPGIGGSGQALLGQARVAIVGVGATGAASASLLARAGVHHLTLVDRDIVEFSNLQRQILFDEGDAAEALPKAEAARRHIARFNSSIEVAPFVADLVPANIADLLADTHLILDCTDNFETRYLINDFAVAHGTPWIYAGAVGAQASTLNIIPSQTACLSCLFPTPPAGQVETCDTAGILSTAVNFAASIQTTEALKLLTGHPEQLRRTFLSVDLWTNRRSEIAARSPDPECPTCSRHQFPYLSGTARPHITLCGRNSVQIHEHHRPLDLARLRQSLAEQPEIDELRSNAMLLRFRRGAQTITVFPDGRALIQGTTDIAMARSLYARFIGS